MKFLVRYYVENVRPLQYDVAWYINDDVLRGWYKCGADFSWKEFEFIPIEAIEAAMAKK